MNRALISILCLLAVAPAPAQTRYVTEDLEVPVRTGRSLENKIVKMLPAGTPVEVVGGSEEGYTRVRTAKGVEGWILTRYLADQPSARDRLAAAEAESASLRQQAQDLSQSLTTSAAEAQELHRASTSLQSENTALRQELEALRRASARPVELAEENERLRRELETVTADLGGARARADALGNSAYRQWFMAGGGVALAGLLLGLILPRLYTRRRRSSWDRL